MVSDQYCIKKEVEVDRAIENEAMMGDLDCFASVGCHGLLTWVLVCMRKSEVQRR